MTSPDHAVCGYLDPEIDLDHDSGNWFAVCANCGWQSTAADSRLAARRSP